MRALSVRQPWAWAIACGHKSILNRSQDTGLRGEVAVHASLRVDLDAFDEAVIRSANWDPADPEAAIGGIVAVVSLVDVCTEAQAGRSCDCGEWALPGNFHWRLARPRPLAWPVLTIGLAGPVGTRAPGRGRRGQAAAPPRARPQIWPPGRGRSGPRRPEPGLSAADEPDQDAAGWRSAAPGPGSQLTGGSAPDRRPRAYRTAAPIDSVRLLPGREEGVDSLPGTAPPQDPPRAAADGAGHRGAAC